MRGLGGRGVRFRLQGVNFKHVFWCFSIHSHLFRLSRDFWLGNQEVNFRRERILLTLQTRSLHSMQKYGSKSRDSSAMHFRFPCKFQFQVFSSGHCHETIYQNPSYFDQNEHFTSFSMFLLQTLRDKQSCNKFGKAPFKIFVFFFL